ncbi:hypothetical protein [Streptomyces sp. NPDC054765]
MRLWGAGRPAERGINSGDTPDCRNRTWQFEPTDTGTTRIRNGLDFYLTVAEGREGVTVKVDRLRSGDQGQLWYLEQPVPGLGDFPLTTALNRALAAGPLEGSHVIENVLVLRTRSTLDQLWTACTSASQKPGDA